MFQAWHGEHDMNNTNGRSTSPFVVLVLVHVDNMAGDDSHTRGK